MSTEIKTIKTKAGDLTLTQFHGGTRGLCVQLTQPQPTGFGHIQLTKEEALCLAANLTDWAFPKPSLLEPGWDKEAV